MLDRNDKSYQFVLETSELLSQSSGIIINSYESLESKPLEAILDGKCPPDKKTPAIFCVGPLISTRTSFNEVNEILPEWLTWLDSQPSRSVVFLCFGSLGLFSKEQLNEIAVGLEGSGQRFLWVVRNYTLLPDGFLNRVKGRGVVVKSWVNQVMVLSHDPISGFVTHCRWNSVLESVWAGVPMVGWPLYAEQRINRIVMVEDMGITLLIGEGEDGFVTVLEVEKRVAELMETESGSGKLIRKKVEAMKKAVTDALSQDGSSRVAFSKLT